MILNAALSLNDVRFSWAGSAGFSLECPSFSIAQGESVLLLGESGSGKSTLLSLICGVVSPQAGSVLVNSTNLSSLNAAKRDKFRAENIGVIFQQFNLLPYATIADNIALPLQFAPKRRERAGDLGTAIKSLCAKLELPPNAPALRAGTLSVGQQQRVAVARALIGQPPLIVADEPTSALDAATQTAFLALLFAQVKEAGSSLVMVSHDARLSDHFDRVVNIAEIVTTQRNAA